MAQVQSNGDKKITKAQNSDPHPKTERGSDLWKLLAQDSLDVLLYEYVEELYEQQGEMIGMFKNNERADE